MTPAAQTRTTVLIPTPSGDTIEAWVYLPEGEGPHPAVVMAHGMAGVKAGGLIPFAVRFQQEGFAAILFDYRQWGGSGGSPRDELSVTRQRADYEAVIGWVVARPEYDAGRIFAWGTSFGGMHIVELAIRDARLAGAIAQAPLTDGLVGAAMVPLRQSLRLMGLALVDRLGSFVGRPPIYIAASADPGQVAAVATPDAVAGLDLIRPTEPAEWENRIAARSLLAVGLHRPARRAASVRCPLLLVVAERDTMAPTSASLRVANRAPGAELFRSQGGHYDVYPGGVAHAAVLDREVEFLHKQAG